MRLLRDNAAFRLIWLANLASSLAGWSLGIALSVHIFTLTGSPLATSALLVASTAPSVALGTVGGVVADRVERGRLLKLVAWLRVLTVAALLVTGDETIGLYAIAFFQAAQMQFFNPAEQAIVADIVSEQHLPQATSANSAAGNVTRLAGPALGGSLVGWIGFSATTAVITGFLALAAVLLALLPPSTQPRRIAANVSIIADWIEGLRTVTRAPHARAVATFQMLDAIKEGPLTSLFPVLMLGTIGTTSSYMGIVNSSFAVTAIVAAPVVGVVIRHFGYRQPIALGATISAILIFILACWPSAATALATFLLSGFPFTISWVAANTWLLINTKPTHRGRVVGTISSLNATATIIFAAIGGAAAEVIPAVVVLAIAATIQAAAGPVFIIMTRRTTAASHPT